MAIRTPTNSRVSPAGTDCDDSLPAPVNPVASEIPADGVDQNCDTYEDCFQDADLDGFGSTVRSRRRPHLACSGLAIARTMMMIAMMGPRKPSLALQSSDSADCMYYRTTMVTAARHIWLRHRVGSAATTVMTTDPSVYFGAPEIPGDGISRRLRQLGGLLR